jgi:two-component system phosphate regulon sensor histidine kinase PhoR
VCTVPKVSPAREVAVGLLPAALFIGFLAVTGHIDPLAGAALLGALCFSAVWLIRGLRKAWARRPVVPAAPPTLVTQEFLEAVPDPVIVLNDAREVMAVNAPAREVLGITGLGRDLAMSLRHPEVLAAVDALSSGALAMGAEITLPVPIARTFTFHGARAPAGGHARDRRIVLVLHDETRARRAEQTQSDFVANASHELRSPLSALIGLIETLRGPAADDASARERFLSIMHTEAGRMARLVDDLMSLSRVEINEHVAPREAVDIEEVLAGVAATLSVRAAGKDMMINVSCPPGTPSVRGDTDQLIQVFHNLLDNAVKYGRPGTTVEVGVAPALLSAGGSAGGGSTAVAISVRDRGEGIAAIHLPRITGRFYRADEGRSRRLGGTGLGLAIVKHIVNRHRGRLLVESIKGEGSTFTVTLPAAAEEPPVRIAV